VLISIDVSFTSNTGAGRGGESLAELLTLSCALDSEKKSLSMQLLGIKSGSL